MHPIVVELCFVLLQYCWNWNIFLFMDSNLILLLLVPLILIRLLSFAPHFTPKQFHMDWLYDAMAEAWNGWIPQDQVKTVK